MSYTITQSCIGCQRCLSACPTEAIRTDGVAFWIEIDRCNQCKGSHGVAQCWAACPTNEGCMPLATGAAAVSLAALTEQSGDYWDAWFTTYTRLVNRLQKAPQTSYWHHWFDTYSQTLKQLQTTAT